MSLVREGLPCGGGDVLRQQSFHLASLEQHQEPELKIWNARSRSLLWGILDLSLYRGPPIWDRAQTSQGRR